MSAPYPFLRALRAADREDAPGRSGAGFWVQYAPLADLSLILFLFLLHGSALVLRPGIRLTLPPAPFTEGVPYGSLVVTISQEGMLFFRDERTTLEGLGPAFAQAARDKPGEILIVEADSRITHQTLVEIYNRAMQAGIPEVALATRMAKSGQEPP